MTRNTWFALGVPTVMTATGARAGGWLYEGSLKVGDRLTLASAKRRHDNPVVRREVQVEVLEIAMFGRLIDEIDTGLEAELVLRGTGLELVAEGTALISEDVARSLEEPS